MGTALRKNAHRTSVPCEDHLGNKYKSYNAMATAYGLKKQGTLVLLRMRMGWSLEKALTTPVRTINTIKYNGVVYHSVNALCVKLGIGYHVLQRRLKQTGDLKTAIELSRVPLNRTKSKDHLGNVYSSFRTMCKVWGQYANTVNARLDNGADIETALTLRGRQWRKKKN